MASIINNKIKELKDALKSIAPDATIRIEISNLPFSTFHQDAPPEKITTHQKKIGEFNHTVLRHEDAESNLLLESAPFNPVPVPVKKAKEGQ